MDNFRGIDHPTNVRVIESLLAPVRATDIAVSAASYVAAVGRQPRLSNGRFAPHSNAVSAASIAINSGVIFA